MKIMLTLWNLINPLLLKLIHNESARQFLSLSPAEQKRLLSDLAQYRGKDEASGQVYQKWSFYLDTIRQHFQLPCTVQTRKARAELLESLCLKSDKILLLGDDDLLSWELAQREFTTVTAADCDVRLLDQIKDLCGNLAVRPRLIPGDFSDAAFDPGIEPDVVCIDPPYNVKWAHIFLSKALQTLRSQDQALLLMMINPHCFSEGDWRTILDRMTESGFDLSEHRPHFNAYPLHGLSSLFLRWGLRMIGVSGHGQQGPLYFSSDLYVFRRSHRAQAVLRSFPPETEEALSVFQEEGSRLRYLGSVQDLLQ